MISEKIGVDRTLLESQLKYGLTLMNIPLNQMVIDLLLDYLGLLTKWNQIHNLTSVRLPEQMVSTHLLDSLSVLPYLLEDNLLDVGTGAGLPGIPLAMAKPNCNVTLLESNHKKAAFLRQAVGELKLPNVDIVVERVEDWKTAVPYTNIIARAFSEIATLVNSSKHLLAGDGRYMAMKGRFPADEIKALPVEFVVREVIELKVPALNAERHLILIGHA